MPNYDSALQNLCNLPLHSVYILSCDERHIDDKYLRNKKSKTTILKNPHSCHFHVWVLLSQFQTHRSQRPQVGYHWQLSCSQSPSLWVSHICHRCIFQTGSRGRHEPRCCPPYLDRLPPSHNQWPQLWWGYHWSETNSEKRFSQLPTSGGINSFCHLSYLHGLVSLILNDNQHLLHRRLQPNSSPTESILIYHPSYKCFHNISLHCLPH